MARMKHIFILLGFVSLCLTPVLPSAQCTVHAAQQTAPATATATAYTATEHVAYAALEETYAVAAANDVWFYSEPDADKGRFILPFSYYVKVVTDGSPFCKVEYLEDTFGYEKVTGYCLRDELQFVDFVPIRPYLYYTVTVSYTVASSSPVGSGKLNTIERNVAFYGTFKHGTEMLCYIYADGEFDYVSPSALTQKVSYDFNTDYLAPTGGDAVSTPSEGGGLTGIQIAVICIACVAAVVVAFFVLRGKKPPVARSEEQTEF